MTSATNILFALVLLLARASADPCMWVFYADEGTSYHELGPIKGSNRCQGGILSYRVKNSNGYSVDFLDSHVPTLKASFNFGLPYGEEASASVNIEVLCNWYTPICGNGRVFFLVRSKETSTTTTSTSSSTSTSTSTTSSTTSPTNSSTTSSTATPAELTCNALNDVTVEVTKTTEVNVLNNVQNCPDPVVKIIGESNQQGSSQKYFSLNGGKLLFSGSKDEGLFAANLRVSCSNSKQCDLTQSVVAKNPLPTEVPTLPDCATVYNFEVTAADELDDIILPNDGDRALCKVDGDRLFSYEVITLPKYNADKFVFTSRGGFSYLAPVNPGTDEFTFVVKCGPRLSSVSFSLCKATGLISIQSPDTPPTTAPGACPGSYVYTYPSDEKDGVISATHNIISSVQANTQACSSPSVAIVSNATQGVVELNADSGDFTYSSAAIAPLKDSFTFKYTCGDFSCSSSASIVVEEHNDPNKVYQLHSDTIYCRGTCDADADQSIDPATHLRKDGKGSDEVSFDFTDDGELLIIAYSRIYNMAARFVTFTPLTAGESLVIPSSIMDGSHMSFEPKCLAKQSETGSANTIWEWTDAEASPPKGHLNTVTKEYKSGANYYHTFGGNHRYCDVFRRDPCTYAPFLTPTLNDDNNNDIDDSPSVQWKLYVNDCDATWVGRASVESLRALRQPDGSATFNLINENQLEGTLYTQVVKPTSWTEPAKGVVSSSKAYKLVLTIKDSIVVDIAVNGGSSMKASTDIQFVSSEHKSTTERVYGYALRIFPYRVNATTQSNEYIDNCKIKDVTLIDYTVKSPNKYDCPTCTGTRYSCTGTGNGYETDCGDAEVVRFEPYDESIINWDQTEESLGGKNLFPSTDLNSTYMLLHRFFVRVRGSNTASSAGSSPMIHFRLKILLDSGESFEVSVDQTSYVSEINANFVHSKVCRSTSYWPVADALGSSLPAKPYNITLATFPDVKYDETLNAVLLSPEQCEANVGSETQVTLPSQKAATTSGKDATMCAAEDVREYGVSDWVFFALPSVTKAESSSTTSQSDTGILVSDGTLKEGQYTIAEIQYLVLSVKATEAISFLSTAESSDVPDDTTEYINILLDGKKPPVTVDAEEDIWMAPDPSNVEALNTVTYYDWMKYASFLNYRRISLEDASSSKKEGNPFNFAFIPGAVLHSSSSVRVPMYMKLAIKFTTYETSKVGGKDSIVGERMEKLFLILPVSRSTSAELRFETDTYTPKLVDVHVDGIGKKTASWLLIVFFVAVVVILAASIYIEVTYKQKIHNAKYKPKRPDSAVGVRYGRDGKPKAGYGYENDSTIAGSTANRDEASSHTKQKVSAKKGTTSKFGTIQTEQVRVGEDDVSVDIEDKLGDEQERVSIGSDEKAKY